MTMLYCYSMLYKVHDFTEVALVVVWTGARLALLDLQRGVGVLLLLLGLAAVCVVALALSLVLHLPVRRVAVQVSGGQSSHSVQ